MLLIKRLVVGTLSTNCYLVFDDKTSQAIIIDPGDDSEYIKETILENSLLPTKTIATHGHFDHILAAGELQLIYKIPFLIHRKDKFLVESMAKRAFYFLKIEIDEIPPKVDDYLKKGDTISVGEYVFDVLETPGHTPGSITLVCKNQKLAFVGDLIFKDGTFGRTDHRYSSLKELKKSVSRIHGLTKETILYPGHGEEFRL